MTHSHFSSVGILHCHRLLTVWISRQLLKNFCQNAMLLSHALLMKVLKIHHNKVHPVMYFRKQHFDPPAPTSVLGLHRSIRNDYGRRINKKPLPPPSPSPSHPDKRKFASGSLRTDKC